ncbi:hypothetical protein RUMCAL_02101 [Ruminococcus callidus ATCC 27760]|uniref:Uncharacterized protein n=1 Tax=Ruminococcus callidus ATCC 27760 TaxID=411473 RepID=U2K6P8_9FIRM|nr:hypothetical protein RUMCAL_02101 [Ruminococcus callidus ATCC 27760]
MLCRHCPVGSKDLSQPDDPPQNLCAACIASPACLSQARANGRHHFREKRLSPHGGGHRTNAIIPCL